MKKIISLFIFLGVSSIVIAQNFEGRIIYQLEYASKAASVNIEQLQMALGTEQKYYIKNGDYKIEQNGSFIKVQLYKSTKNQSYTLTGQSDVWYWKDCSKSDDEAISYELLKSQETILGVSCDVLIVKAKNSKTHFYFNSKYGIDYDLFKGHNYGNWYYMISKAKALPLKTIYENSQFTMTVTATQIDPMKLEDSFFTIPDGTSLAPATW